MCQYKCPVCSRNCGIFDSSSPSCLQWGYISILPEVSINYYQQLSKVTALVTAIVHKEQRNMFNVRGAVLFYAFFFNSSCYLIVRERSNIISLNFHLSWTPFHISLNYRFLVNPLLPNYHSLPLLWSCVLTHFVHFIVFGAISLIVCPPYH